MNKTELIEVVATKAEMTKKDAAEAINAFTEVVTEQLAKGEQIQILGFGTFVVSERKAREGKNPQTGETIKIDACKVPKFKVGKCLKDMVNQ